MRLGASFVVVCYAMNAIRLSPYIVAVIFRSSIHLTYPPSSSSTPPFSDILIAICSLSMIPDSTEQFLASNYYYLAKEYFYAKLKPSTASLCTCSASDLELDKRHTSTWNFHNGTISKTFRGLFECFSRLVGSSLSGHPSPIHTHAMGNHPKPSQSPCFL